GRPRAQAPGGQARRRRADHPRRRGRDGGRPQPRPAGARRRARRAAGARPACRARGGDALLRRPLARRGRLRDPDLERDRRARVGGRAGLALPAPLDRLTPVTPERYARLKELVADALDTPAPQRAVALERACAGDGALLAEVRALLDAHARAEGGAFLA